VTERFGDGGRSCFIRKKCFFEILQWLNYQRCLLDKHFCCHPEGKCGFSSAGGLVEFSATVIMCGRKYGLCNGDSKGDMGGPWPPQIFAWPPVWPPSFFGKEFASERVEAAYIARKIFVIYNY